MGRTEATGEILTRMLADTPGIVITQHIPPAFFLDFANRLNQVCTREVKEAADGDVVMQ